MDWTCDWDKGENEFMQNFWWGSLWERVHWEN